MAASGRVAEARLHSLSLFISASLSFIMLVRTLTGTHQADAVRNNDQPCDSGYRFYGTVRIIPPLLSLSDSSTVSFPLPLCVYVSLSGERRLLHEGEHHNRPRH